MARPLRIEYPNAWYHVMNQGRRGEAIFQEASDYEMFIKLLQETKERFNLFISAYCLMSTQYHLLIQTPHANLSRCMRHINGVYTQRFNRSHHTDSQLFRGRYKAIVIEAEAYLLEVLRYIHRIPINIGLEEKLGSYPWSSYSAYLSKEKKRSWLHKKALLQIFAAKPFDQLRLYERFVEIEEPESIQNFYEAKKLPAVMGGETFIQQIRETYLKAHSPHVFPEIKQLVPSEDAVIAQVCLYYQIPQATLFLAKRGQRNLARDVAIFLIRDLCYTPYKQIALTFQINTPSAISTVTARIRKQMENDTKLSQTIQKIKKSIKTN